MRAGSCAVVTPAARHPVAIRQPLARLVLPIGLNTQWNSVGMRRVWWLESKGERRFLRAMCEVESTYVEENRERGEGRLVLHLAESTSERISWPGRSDGVLHTVESLPAYGIVPLSEAVEGRLEDLRYDASTVSGGVGARRKMKRLLAQTAGEREPLPATRLSVVDAARYVRHYFARAELFRVETQDPFDVAARVLSGVPLAVDRHRSAEMPGLRKIGMGKPSLPPFVRSIASVSSQSTELERSARRHSLIVQELAAVLYEFGYRPEYNRHVDVVVTTPNTDVLFEVKSTREGTFREQARAAVGQLFEYRYQWNRTRGRDVRLAAVLEATTSAQDQKSVEGFLSSLGIRLVLWHGINAGFSSTLRELLLTLRASSGPATSKARSSLRQHGICDG